MIKNAALGRSNITKGRLNRMVKYFRRFPVEIHYTVNCSVEYGTREVRLKGRIKDFTLKEEHGGFNLRIDFHEGYQFDEYFHASSVFTGLGSIVQSNGDGTYSFFYMKKV